MARDVALGTDGRTYVLYLAWFGPGLTKAGLTAADRGRDRLLEQGAITWTPLARGPYTPIRRAERLISASGIAPERLPSRATVGSWWNLPAEGERAASLADAHQSSAACIRPVTGIDLMPCQVIDQVADFGLSRPPPATYLEVTGLSGDAALTGEILLIVGRRLLLATASAPLLIDMRRAAGWITATSAATAATGLKTITRTRPADRHDHDTLF